MDLRIEKTKKNIINSFIELRSQKPLEKIRVIELCEKAQINKSTFYSHYHDIYDLQEKLEDETIQSCLAIFHPGAILYDITLFCHEFYQVFTSHEHLLSILFPSNRSSIMIEKICSELIKLIYEQYPIFKNNPTFNTILCYRLYGSCYAFKENKQFGEKKVVEVITKLCSQEDFDLKVLNTNKKAVTDSKIY